MWARAHKRPLVGEPMGAAGWQGGCANERADLATTNGCDLFLNVVCWRWRDTSLWLLASLASIASHGPVQLQAN